MSVAARLFVRITERLRRTAPRAEVLWSAFWLGVLPRSAMAAIDEALFALRSHYASAAHNRMGLSGWERDAVDGWFAPRSRVMVLGVGGGREVIALRKLGFDAFGWESHPALLAVARALAEEDGYPDVVRPVARDALPDGAQRYDAIIFGWGMYMLVQGRARRIALLRAARGRLAGNGPVLLSFFARGEDDQRARRIHQVASVVRRLLRRPRPEPGDDMLPNAVHRFTRDEIDSELREAGFELLHYDPAGKGPLESGWAVGRPA